MTEIGFRIIKKDRASHARLGVLKTHHGTVQTPAYVMVATHGYIKTLTPSDISKTKTQIVISNTYHLWEKGRKNKKTSSLVHNLLGASIPVMTDSGGFQVFSFGAAKEHGVGKVLKQPVHRHAKPSKIKITEKGVYFELDGRRKLLTPEISIDLQERIGADMIFAFDECTSPLHSKKYNKAAMERTHRWLVRCIRAHKKKGQILYGIIQGGRFAGLRKQSARFIGSQPVGGIAIGGSFGKEEMAKTLNDVVDYLPEEKPRHLLGIGMVEDIFTAVGQGMDTFDCVIPTREARHGKIYTDAGAYDIRKSVYKNSRTPLGSGCRCPSCSRKITKAKLHALFKSKNPEAGRAATLHNVWFFNNLLAGIRKSIKSGKFLQFRDKYIRRFRQK